MKYALMVKPMFAKEYSQEGEAFDTRAEAEVDAVHWRVGGCKTRIDEVSTVEEDEADLGEGGV